MRESSRSQMKIPSMETQQVYSDELSGTSFTSSPSPEDTRLCESNIQSRVGRASVIGNDCFPRAEDGDRRDDDRDEGLGSGGSSQPARRTQDSGGAQQPTGVTSRRRGFQEHVVGVSDREDTLESEEGDGGDEESTLEDKVGGGALVRGIEDVEDYVGKGEMEEGETDEEEHVDDEGGHEEDAEGHDEDEEEHNEDEEEHYEEEEEERNGDKEDLEELVELGVDCGEDADGDRVNQGIPETIRMELVSLKLSVRDYEDRLAELYGTRDRSEWKGRVTLMADLVAANSHVDQLENEVEKLRKELRSFSQDPNRGAAQGNSDSDTVIELDHYKILVADLQVKLSGLEEDNSILAKAAGWESDPAHCPSGGEQEAKGEGKRMSQPQARRLAAIDLMRTRLKELAERVSIAEQEEEAARVAADESEAERDQIMTRSNKLLAAARHFKRGKALAEARAEAFMHENQELRDAQESREQLVLGSKQRAEEYRRRSEALGKEVASAHRMANRLAEEVATRSEAAEDQAEALRDELEQLNQARGAAEETAEAAAARALEAEKSAEAMRAEIAELKNAQRQAEQLMEDAAAEVAETQGSAEDLRDEIEGVKDDEQSARRSAEQAAARAAEAESVVCSLREELQELKDAQQSARMEVEGLRSAQEAARVSAEQARAATAEAEGRVELARDEMQELRASHQEAEQSAKLAAVKTAEAESTVGWLRRELEDLKNAHQAARRFAEQAEAEVARAKRTTEALQEELEGLRRAQQASAKTAAEEAATIGSKQNEGGGARHLETVTDRIARLETDLHRWREACLRADEKLRRETDLNGATNRMVMERDASMQDLVAKLGETRGYPCPREDSSSRSVRGGGRDSMLIRSQASCTRGRENGSLAESASTQEGPRGGSVPADARVSAASATRSGCTSPPCPESAPATPATVLPTNVDGDGGSDFFEDVPCVGATTGATGAGQYDQLPRGDVLQFATSFLEESSRTISSTSQDQDFIHSVDDGTAHPLAADSSAETVANGVCFDMSGAFNGRTSGVPPSLKTDAQGGQQQVEGGGNSREELDAATIAQGPGKAPTLEANSAIPEQTDDRAAVDAASPGWRGEPIGSDATGLERSLPTAEDETASTAEVVAQGRAERVAWSAELFARQAQGSAAQARLHRAAAEASEQRAASEATVIRDAAAGLSAAPMYGFFRAPQHQQKHQQARDVRQEEAVRRAKQAARRVERTAMAARLERLEAETAAEAATSAGRFATGVLDRGYGESPAHFIPPWRGGVDERLNNAGLDTARGGEFQSSGIYALGREYQARRGEKIGEEEEKEEEDEVGRARSTGLRHGVSITGGRASEEGNQMGGWSNTSVGLQPATHRRQSVGLDGDPQAKSWDGRPLPEATRGRSRNTVQKVTDSHRGRSQRRRRSQTRSEDPPLDSNSGQRGAGGMTQLRRKSRKVSGGIETGTIGKRTSALLSSSVGADKEANTSRQGGVCARVCANPTCACGENPDPVALAAWHARRRLSRSGRAR